MTSPDSVAWFRKYSGKILSGPDQGLSIRDVKAIAIKIGEQPFMGIECIRIGQFDAMEEMRQLRADHR